MGILGSMLAGAAESGGNAVSALAAKSTLAQEQADIQAARDARLREWHNTDTVAAEKRHIENIPLTQAAETPGLLSRAQGISDIGVEAHKKTAAIDTEQRIAEFTKLAPLKRQEAIDTAVAQLKAMSTPEMLKAERAIAQAKHIVDPSFVAVPEADGTVTMYDQRSGKTKKMVGEDGEPILRKDPEELKAATSVINMANTNLKIAEAKFKATSADAMADPATKAAAAAEWTSAQQEAKRLSAPAYAVLYAKAGIEDKVPAAEKGAPAGAPAVGTVINGKTFKGGDPYKAENWAAKSAEPKKGVIDQPVSPLEQARIDARTRGTEADAAAARENETKARATIAPELAALNGGELDAKSQDNYRRLNRLFASPVLDAADKAKVGRLIKQY